jgi:eukaryotic-like serine/threonine-protein kinase
VSCISEPDIRLGGRYRLEDRHRTGRGWAAWKAIDETLGRAVTVLTLADGFPRIADTMAAARAVSRVTDARLARVFDANTDRDRAYVVTEWVGGDSLDDLLADGALDPRHAAEIIVESAEALASAHAAGVAHLCLGPGSLRWTAEGGVKIAGLGMDAALAGVTADDPVLADTQALGRLLYGALTARWPGGIWPSLPPAPEVGGQLRRPRQVRAGIPTGLDEVCCRVPFPGSQGRDRQPPVTTPALLAAALNRVIPAPAVSRRYITIAAGRGGFAPVPPHQPRHGGTVGGGWPPLAARLLASVAAILLVAAGIAGICGPGHHGGSQSPGHPSHHAAPAAVLARVLSQKAEFSRRAVSP